MSEKKLTGMEDAWMIRPCETYREEYQDCKRWVTRLSQYYVDGEFTDCKVWLNDYNNCIAFRKNKDQISAALAVIGKEKEIRRDRLQKANANDVWEYRTSPPAQWASPLSDTKHQESNAS